MPTGMRVLTNGFKVPNWIIALVFIFAIAGYGLFAWETYNFRNYQREVLEGELAKLLPIREEVDSLTRAKQITLQDIQETQTILEKLKSKLNNTESDEMTLEEALKLLSDDG